MLSSNYVLRAMLEDDRSLLTVAEDKWLPRKGENECARIVRCYGVEMALDILEEGAEVDGLTDTTLRIDGCTGYDKRDPLVIWGEDAITKTFKSGDLRATRERWAKLGRTIANVTVV